MMRQAVPTFGRRLAASAVSCETRPARRPRLRRRGFDLWSEGIVPLCRRSSCGQFLAVFAGTGLIGLTCVAGVAREAAGRGLYAGLTATPGWVAILGLAGCLAVQGVIFVGRCRDSGLGTGAALSGLALVVALCGLAVSLGSTAVALAAVGVYFAFAFRRGSLSQDHRIRSGGLL
jgi:hypothetical protein